MTDRIEQSLLLGANGIPGGEVGDPKMRAVFEHLGALIGADPSDGYGDVLCMPGGNFYHFSRDGLTALRGASGREDLDLPADLTEPDDDGTSAYERAQRIFEVVAGQFDQLQTDHDRSEA